MKAKTIVLIVLYSIFAIVILIGSLFLIRFFSNGQKMFYVRYGANSYTGDVDLSLYENEYNFIFCDYLIKDGSNRGYSIEIVPNKDVKNFSFFVGDAEYRFLGKLPTLTNAFDIKEYSNYFTIYIPNDYSVLDVLRKAYDNDNIVGDGDVDLSSMLLAEKSYFTIVVNSYNKDETVNISFKTVQRSVNNE